MIIIEGSDNLGKTVAAHKLSALIADHLKLKPDACYRHMTKPPDDFDHVREYMEMLKAVAQDRFHLGAITYGRLTGNGNCPTSRDMRMVQRYLRWQGCITVVLHSERDWLRKQRTSKEEMYGLETILDVNEAYRALIRTTNRGEPYHDFEHDVSKHGYPDEKKLAEWFSAWRDRWTA